MVKFQKKAIIFDLDGVICFTDSDNLEVLIDEDKKKKKK